MMRYCFDLDETICATPSSRNYAHAVPYLQVIAKINSLFDAGHEITIFTARGSTSGIDHHELNLQQLRDWGLKYHVLIDRGKPSYDLFVDDKAISASAWREREKIRIVGFVASCFDLLHAGHCLFLREARSVCDYLVAGLQVDPSVDRKHKNKPIQSLFERKTQLESVRYVDEVMIYEVEADLDRLLGELKPDIRILGSDAIGIPTGFEHCKNVYFHERDHNFSSSELRERIKNGT